MAGRGYFHGIPVSSTNKTDHHDITEILLKVALNTISSLNYLVIIDILVDVNEHEILSNLTLRYKFKMVYYISQSQ